MNCIKLRRKVLSTRYSPLTMVEFVGSHCGQEGQDCRCRTLESGKKLMWLLECGGEIFCKSSNSCDSGKEPMWLLEYGEYID